MGRLLVLLSLACGSMFGQCAGTWTNGYTYCRSVTVASGVVSGTLTNFPFVIAGTYSYLATGANGGRLQLASGADMMIASDNAGTTPLPMYRKEYNAVTGAVVIWVQVPSFATSTQVYLFYGNATAADLSSSLGIWDANYTDVRQFPTSQLSAESALTGFPATNQAVSTATLSGTGLTTSLGGAGTFGGRSFLIAGDWPQYRLSQSQSITISAWVKLANTTSYQDLVRYDDSSNALYLLRMNAGKPEMLIGSRNTTIATVTSATTLTVGTWYLVSGVRNVGSTNITLYINGAADTTGSDTSSGTWTTANSYLMYGANGVFQEFYHGALSETRVSIGIARSAAWHAAEYANQSAPGASYTLGSEVTFAQTPPSTTPFTATNEVVFLGTTIGTAGSLGSNGNTIAKLFDGDFTTFWDAPNAVGDWAGLDLGAAAIVTRLQVATHPGSTSANYEYKATGVVFQGSSSATFSSAANTFQFDSIPAFPYLPRGQFSERAGINPYGWSYRYWRIVEAPQSNGGLAEIRIIGQRNGSVNSKPIEPAIAPWGGRYPSGSATVTLTSLTTSAAIYFTTDGTTPSNTNGTLYAGTFSLSITAGAGGTTLKAVAYDAAQSTPLSDVSVSYFKAYGIKPNDDWYDDHGHLVEAHAGSIYGPVSGLYYWVGMNFNRPNCTSGCPFAPSYVGANNSGIWEYSSPDLLNWKLVGQITDGASFNQVERPAVLFNASTGKYVMWVHAATTYVSKEDRPLVATASAPQGPWTWSTAPFSVDFGAPDGYGVKDCSAFKDGSGVGWFIYNSGTQIVVSKMASDYLTTTGVGADQETFSFSITREAPAMLQRGASTFFFSNFANVVDSTQEEYQAYTVSATGAIGTYPSSSGVTTVTPVFAADPIGTNYNGQTTGAAWIAGYADCAMWMGDYWAQPTLYNSRQAWSPLTFASATTTRAGIPATWTPASVCAAIEAPGFRGAVKVRGAATVR